jgi:hypothetical protein
MLVLELAAQLGGVDRDVDDARLVSAEHHLALERVGGVVEVDDRARRALDALVRALDQLLPALHEHLDRDVVGDQVVLDELADEVEVGLAGRRKADFDLLEAHLDDGVEHAPLADGIHRVDQRLVAVTEIDRAPQRGLVDDRIRPRAIVQDERDERSVLVECHRAGCCRGRGHWCFLVIDAGEGAQPGRKMKNPPAGRCGGRANAMVPALALRKEEQAGAGHHDGRYSERDGGATRNARPNYPGRTILADGPPGFPLAPPPAL